VQTVPGREGDPAMARATHRQPAQAGGRVGIGAWLREGVLVALALLSLWLIPKPDVGWVRWANLLIWVVFLADYVVRLCLAPRKATFIRQNIPSLIASLPLDFLRPVRLLRLVRLVRLVRIGGLLICAVEPAMGNYGNGLWWSVVTLTTVGYGDISPTTVAGRVTAVALMIVGIGLVGTVTASLATYFISPKAQASPVEYVRSQLANWDKLSREDRRRLATLVRLLAEDEGKIG
jgi:voltage-gated potassium channel